MTFPAGQNVLSYLGVEAKSPPNLVKAQRAPTTGDLNHKVGTLWVNQSLNNVWMLTSVAGGSANWEPVSQSAGGNAPITEYVVDAAGTGDYTTIQAAITAATGGAAVIYIRPGTYTESLTLVADQVIQGAGLETIITGVHVPPATGDVTFYDCNMTSATHLFNTDDAGTGRLLLFNVLVNCTNGYTFNLNNWVGNLQMVSCAEESTANGVVNNTGGADVALWQTVAGAGTSQDFTLDDGTLTMFNGRLVCQMALGGATTISATMGSSFGGTLTLGGTANGNISNSTFSTGATAALSQGGTGQINLSNVTIDTTNDPAIAGAGAGGLLIAGVDFLSGSNLAATLTILNTSTTRVGNIRGTSAILTNTNIESFNVNPILQSAVDTGAAPSGATGALNVMYLQDGITAEQFIIGAGQTIIAPRLDNSGLLISLDLTATEGAEYNFGTTTRSRHTYTIGTSPAFYVDAQFTVADVSGCEPLLLGFRAVAGNNATYTSYTDYATIGIKTSANADLISLSTEVGGGGTTDTNTTDAWTDGQTHTLRVNVSAAGVVTYLIDGVAPSATAAYTFTNALQVMPFITMTHAAAAPGAIHLVSLACGLQ